MSQSIMQQALRALKALRDHFPSDVDMAEAGYTEQEIEEACTALEDAPAIIAALEKELALHTAGPDKEVAAWVHSEDSSRVISDEQKVQGMRDGGASASSVKPYNVPLYAAGAASQIQRWGYTEAEPTILQPTPDGAWVYWQDVVGLFAFPVIEANDAKDVALCRDPVAWMHVQGNHFDPSLRRLDDDEKSRGWTQFPLYAAMSTHQPKEKDNADR